MATRSERQRNNFKVGVFVTIALLMGMGVIWMLSDLRASIGSKNAYEVVFDVTTGVNHLKPGSDVRVGGLNMGKVKSVSFRGRTDSDADDALNGEDGVVVAFEVVSSLELFDNPPPTIRVAGPLIGAESWLEIIDLGGTPEDPDLPASTTPLVAGMQFPGQVGNGQIESFLGPEGSVIIQNVAEFTDFLARLEDLYERDVLPVVADAQNAMNRTSSLLDDLYQDEWPRWSGDVDDMLASGKSGLENFDDATEQAEQLMTDARGVIDENRSNIHDTTENVREVTAKANDIADDAQIFVKDVQAIGDEIRNKTMAKVDQFLNEGIDALDSANEVLVQVKRDYPAWATDLTETMTSARQTGQQLKLTAIEVRRSPWKLLYQPSSSELEHELLYEAARSFAFAATDLTAASDAASRMLENNQEQFQQDPELFRRLMNSLVDPIERFEKAQKELFSAIKLEQ